MSHGSYRKRVAVLAGGYSGEAVISMQSAATVMEHIDRDLYDPLLVQIDKDKWWVHTDGNHSINKDDFTFTNSSGGSVGFDSVFIMVHGTPGEDGILQEYFEKLNIPITTGSSVSVSGTFNKFGTTSKLREAGFKVGDSVELDALKDVSNHNYSEISQKIGLPCFVKPNQGGSSLGISKVSVIEELQVAVQSAKDTGCPTIIIESLLEGREFSMGVIPNENGEPMAMPITEIVTDNEFFDYEAKYEGASDETTPADLDHNFAVKMQDAGVRAYKLLGCKGMVRIDFILCGEESAILEVNSVPGFSKMSILPQQLQCAGITIKTMLTRVLEQA